MNAARAEQRTDRRIAIISAAPPIGNPRVVKEAATLAGSGFDVTVVATAGDHAANAALAAKHGFSFRPVGFLDTSSPWNQVRRLGLQLRNWLARNLHRRFGIESRYQLGPLAGKLFHAAELVRADYHIVHLESALWVGSELLHLGRTVGVDFEDWYSEDLPPEARKQRPIRLLRSLERKLLRNGLHCTCTSRAMADALAQQYDCPPPVVIYNAFPWRDRETIDGLSKDRTRRQMLSIHWFSQTLGPGRGLEDLIAALPLLQSDAEIHLRGKAVPRFLQWLDSQLSVNLRSRVFIHDVVMGEELISRIAEHDIGFAGEQEYCQNKILTVSNKILHYLLGGLAVVASDTTGQREVAEQATGAVYLYRTGDPQDLARCLNLLLASPSHLMKAKEAAITAAKETFCWEKQATRFLHAIDIALSSACP
jgi:glycosyltransferase involved in cell wall biosynthesis